MTAAIEPWPRPEFERRLSAAAGGGADGGGTLRLLRLVESGRCPPTVLRDYVSGIVRGARTFIRTLTVLIEAAPDAEARLVLLENLMEEEGVALRRGHGIVVHPHRGHIHLAERLAKAVGAPLPDADAAGGIDGERVAGLVDQGRWLEAVAFLLVGQEAGFPAVAARMHAAFRRMGYAAEDLMFFQVHQSADERHGAQALALVAARARSRAEQEAALASAAAGRRDWVARHGGLGRAA
jgi:pyrroloquinoline quinone (PQQ) biosynthesis protein C